VHLTTAAPDELATPFAEFAATVAARLHEADDFYHSITPVSVQTDPDRAQVMRQALAGMLWIKQYFYYDLDTWLTEHQASPGDGAVRRKAVRNADWYHMLNDDIISMPDKWEYPWYAAWDLAFHTLALALVDPDFAKSQLDLMLRNDYMHPNGQMPAYEWNFSDVNPPVHACHHADLPARQGAQRRQRRHRIPEICLCQTAGELHLVDQPQGSHRRQRLRGRLPRPRQHRRLRPQRTAAHRRQPGTGRRHGVDGLLQPADAAHRRRAGAA
jgi:hypothetical protein